MQYATENRPNILNVNVTKQNITIHFSVENIIKQNIWSTLFSANFLLVIREGEKTYIYKASHFKGKF